MFKVIQNPKSRIKTYYKTEEKQTRRKEIFLFAMFLFGLVFGALTVRTSESAILDRLYALIQNYITVKAQQSLWVNLSNAFFKRIVLFIILYCVGTCAFGAPVLYAAPAIHGAGIGMISAYLYSAFALKGIEYCIFMLYPGEILFTAAMIMGCSTSIEMTGILMQLLSGKQSMQESSLRTYTAKYGILLALCAVSAVLETALHSTFSGYFQFS